MKNKLSKFFTPKRILLAVVFFCVVLTATSFFTDKLITPLRNVFSYIVVPIQNGINSIGSGLTDDDNKKKTLEELQTQNKELESQVASLKAENDALKSDADELSDLRNFYGMESQLSSYTKVGARVIGTTSTNWNQSFTIDQGSKKGIKVDMNVITDKGLVGIVTEVYDSYSVVTTIVADNSNVAAMDERTKDQCIVEGDITLMDSGIIKLSRIKSNAGIKSGDKIVTSNISSKYLPGLLVGYVKDITSDDSGLSKSGNLVPAADFDHLTDVVVITTTKDQLTNG
ncbi:rod shape-determining protein MreC [Howardella ureilytica]|nr:rod shape-determining protein MreC [Lachnospiraceae bacterium]MDY2956470.1 rod shape-determining protein MreC [Lachnospiraceae bacterium]